MLSNTLDIPVDAYLGDWREALSPRSVLEALRERLTRVEPHVRRAWRDCRVIEALVHPSRYVRVAYALLADPQTPDDRLWPEGQIVYLHAPVRGSDSARGERIELGGRSVEAYSFPNDRRLRAVRRFAGKGDALAAWQSWLDAAGGGERLDGDSLQRLLMRYVPEQKWIVRLRGEARGATGEPSKRRIAVRAALPQACRELAQRHRALAGAARALGGDLVIPDVVGFDADEGLLATEWLRGDSLIESLRAGDSGATLTRVALALRDFQGLPAGAVDPAPPNLAERVRDSVADLGLAEPAIRSRAAAVAGAWRAMAAGLPEVAPVLLHNDFHWNQATIKRGRVVLLDLERTSQGDALVDVANFITQLRMLPVRGVESVTADEAEAWVAQFLDAWRRAGGAKPDSLRLRLYSVVTLLELARGMMRHARPGWRRLADSCVQRCEAALSGIPAEAAS